MAKIFYKLLHHSAINSVRCKCCAIIVKPFLLKMVRSKSRFAKCFNLVLIVSCVNFGATKSQQIGNSFFDFERVKNDLFLNSDFSNSNKVSVFNSQGSRQDDAECTKQLNEIRNALSNFEPWAMKRKLNWKRKHFRIFN